MKKLTRKEVSALIGYSLSHREYYLTEAGNILCLPSGEITNKLFISDSSTFYSCGLPTENSFIAWHMNQNAPSLDDLDCRIFFSDGVPSLTNSEREEATGIINKIREKYLKRLQTYYSKNKDRIYFCHLWY